MVRCGVAAEWVRTDVSWLVNVARLDAHFAALRVDDTRTVGSNESRLRLTPQGVRDLRHGGLRCTREVTETGDAP